MDLNLTGKEAAINPADLIERQLTLRGFFVFPLHGYDPMLALVRHHGEDLESIVTHRAPLEAAPEVIPLCDAGRTGKAVFVWEYRCVRRSVVSR